MAKAPGPDGLEAWCVALAASFINFVMAGLGRMSGILFVAFIDIYNIDRMQASVPLSVRSLMRNLFGPVVGILGQKYGVRATTVLGGILGTVSAAVCFYTTNILWITIMWGVLNGAAAALSITLPQVVLGQHFKKYKTTASGMAFSGGCVGSFLFPAMLEWLLRAYGLAGTFLILAGITMNVIPAAMLLNKPSWMKNNTKKNDPITNVNINFDKTAEERNEESNEKSDRNVYGQLNSRSKCDRYNNPSDKYHQSEMHCSQSNSVKEMWDKYMSAIEYLRKHQFYVTKLITCDCFLGGSLLNETRGNFTVVSSEKFLKKIEEFQNNIKLLQKNNGAFVRNTPGVSSEESSTKQRVIYQNVLQNKMRSTNESTQIVGIGRHSEIKNESQNSLLLFLSKIAKEDRNNIYQNFPQHEHKIISDILQQLRIIHELLEESEYYKNLPSNPAANFSDTKYLRGNPPTDTKNQNTFYDHAKTAFRLHANPLFLLISLCRSVHFLTFVPAVTIIVDFCMDRGLLEEDGKYVIAALSLGDLMGRLCLGWVTDREYVALPRYMLCVMVIQGACTASLAMMPSKLTLLLAITLFGLLQGSLFVRHPVLVSRYLGKHEQSVAMGCFNFFSGLLGFTLPNYIGYFRDTIGAYDGMFYINGGIGAFIGILWFFEPYFVKRFKLDKTEELS